MQTLLNIPGAQRPLTPQESCDAVSAYEALAGTGLTLLEAANIAANCTRVMRRISFTTAVDEFVLTRIRSGLKRKSVDWYDERLRPLSDLFGARLIDQVTSDELQEQLVAAFPTAPARHASARACRALWRWGMRCDPAITGADITIGLRSLGSTLK